MCRNGILELQSNWHQFTYKNLPTKNGPTNQEIPFKKCFNRTKSSISLLVKNHEMFSNLHSPIRSSPSLPIPLLERASLKESTAPALGTWRTSQEHTPATHFNTTTLLWDPKRRMQEAWEAFNANTLGVQETIPPEHSRLTSLSQQSKITGKMVSRQRNTTFPK